MMMNVLSYDGLTLIDVCQAINRRIGQDDPFSDLIFVPWEQESDDTADWTDGPVAMDSTLRLTFYATVCWMKADQVLRTCGLWLIHVHKATGHAFGMKVQGETEPDWMTQTFSIVVPSLAVDSLRDI